MTTHQRDRLASFFIVFVEGYATLAVQMLTLRLLAPVAGLNVVATSIVIGMMLLALSSGYWRGGEIAARLDREGVLRHLTVNLAVSGLFFALLLPRMGDITAWAFADMGYFAALFFTATIVLFVPVYLASQTTPLITRLLTLSSDVSAPQAVGRLIFASTIGSFLGSVVTTILLLPRIGLTYNIVLVGILCLLLALLTNALQLHRARRGTVILLSLVALSAASLIVRAQSPGTHFSTAYQDVHIYDTTYRQLPWKMFSLDGAWSSGRATVETSQPYFNYIAETIRLTDDLRPKKILVIGAAGYVYPSVIAERDYVETLHVSEIDGALRPIAEEYFLGKKLWENMVVFDRWGARYFLSQTAEKYDLIFVDAYTGNSIPAELLTREFFQDIADHLTQSGALINNMILDSSFQHQAAQSILATMRASGMEVFMKKMGSQGLMNILVSQTPLPWFESWQGTGEVWTDDRNDASRQVWEMYQMKSLS